MSGGGLRPKGGAEDVVIRSGKRTNGQTRKHRRTRKHELLGTRHSVNYLFKEFNISMTTRTDRAIVIGLADVNILQSISGNILGSAGHCVWCVCWKLHHSNLLSKSWTCYAMLLHRCHCLGVL